MAAVDDFQAGVNPRVIAIRPAFQVSNIRASTADDCSDFGEQTGAIFGMNGELNRERRGGLPAPFDGDAAFRFVHQILDVRTKFGVNRDAATARDVTGDVVAGNRIATLRAKDEQPVVTFDDERRFAHAEHTLNGLDDGRLCIVGGRVRRLRAFAKHFGNNLAGGIFAEANGREQILDLGKAMILGNFFEVGFRNLLEGFAEGARFLFEKALAHVGGFFPLMQIDPMADFAARVGRLGKA